MRKTVLLLILIFVIPLASALMETHVFFVGDSFEVSGKNVTLIDIGKNSNDEDVLVVCVNNQKGIVTDEQEVNDVEFNFENIESNYVELRLKFPSSGDCDESCSNILCFNGEQQTQITDEDTETEVECTSNTACHDNNENTIDTCIENKCIYEPISDSYIVGKKKQSNSLLTTGIILLIIVIVLLLILFFIKFKKKR